MSTKSKKVALVHDWFLGYYGSEKVVRHILDQYSDADLFSLVDYMSEGDKQYLHYMH